MPRSMGGVASLFHGTISGDTRFPAPPILQPVPTHRDSPRLAAGDRWQAARFNAETAEKGADWGKANDKQQ